MDLFCREEEDTSYGGFVRIPTSDIETVVFREGGVCEDDVHDSAFSFEGLTQKFILVTADLIHSPMRVRTACGDIRVVLDENVVIGTSMKRYIYHVYVETPVNEWFLNRFVDQIFDFSEDVIVRRYGKKPFFLLSQFK